MITRRDALKSTLAMGTTLALASRATLAADAASILTRTIPRSGERLPVIGLGTSATVSRTAASGETQSLRAVLETLLAGGGTVVDTAPAYGQSEKVMGDAAREAGIAGKLFWATKLNVARGGSADPQAARAQLDTSLSRLDKRPLDLVQVHNMADTGTQLPILREYQQAGRIRYVGVTTTFAPQYDALERLMQRETLDFIGVDYAIDSRTMEERIFPLAQDKGVAVLVYAPFGRTRLWQAVRTHQLPPWAGEIGAGSWGQFFLKFVLSQPVVTAVTPATSNPVHMQDNLGAGHGPLPDAAMRRRMIDYIETLA